MISSVMTYDIQLFKVANSGNPIRLGNNPVKLSEEVLYNLYSKIIAAYME